MSSRHEIVRKFQAAAFKAWGPTMEVKSFTYEKNVFGTYFKRGLLNLQKMDDHIAMLNDGWEILTQTAHTGDRRILRPFAKRDAITVSFRRK